MRRGKVWAGLGAAALRMLAFAALVFALSGFGIPTRTASRQVETVALIDQSRSIAPINFPRPLFEPVPVAFFEADQHPGHGDITYLISYHIKAESPPLYGTGL